MMEVLDIFLGWPRQYNYWDRKRGRWHRVGGSYVTRREAEELFRGTVKKKSKDEILREFMELMERYGKL
jgi:hypothetical protein